MQLKSQKNNKRTIKSVEKSLHKLRAKMAFKRQGLVTNRDAVFTEDGELLFLARKVDGKAAQVELLNKLNIPRKYSGL